MRPKRKTYNTARLVSALFMALTLAWLTVSIPFVNATQQQLASELSRSAAPDGNPAGDEDSSNPFSNTTEEKNPSNGSTIAEEFLHEQHLLSELYPSKIDHNKCTHPAVYVAFHGELLSPPPEA